MQPSIEHLKHWSAQWRGYQRLRRLARADAQPEFEAGGADAGEAAGGMADSAGHLNVSTGFSLPDLLLEQMNRGITPTLGQQAADESAHLLASAGVRLKAEPIIRPGQVLHLPPECHAEVGRTVFALVTHVDSGHGTARVIPFGPVETPALPSELSTGIGDQALRVLCLWNAAELPLRMLERSWLVSECDAALLSDVEALQAGLEQKKEVPANLRDRVGPPLIHPDDPRHEFIYMEEQLWIAD